MRLWKVDLYALYRLVQKWTRRKTEHERRMRQVDKLKNEAQKKLDRIERRNKR